MMYRLLLNGTDIAERINESWIEKVPTIDSAASILTVKFHGRVIPVIDQEQRVIGKISAREMIMAQEFLIHSIQHNVNIIDIILDIAYEGVTVVDRNGFIVKMNQAYRNYLGIDTDEVIGKHVTDIIDNTQLHKTVKTGIPQRGELQVIRGQKMIVHRIPIWRNNELIGAIGMLIFEGVTELYRILENATKAPNSLTKQLVDKNIEVPKKGTHSKTFDQILGVSGELTACKRISKKAAKSNATVLITGESGTGKEVFAQAIHSASSKNEGSFVAINCAAIPENLLESELFGYEDGAFTGSRKGGSRGKFEMANGGTMFLDEIGDMPKQMQTKILRVLEEREVVKVGGSSSIPINVRIIAATNHNLFERVKEGLFREDLYYRLNVIHIEIPPLRRRREDIPLLFSHYLKHFSEVYGVNEKKVDHSVMEQLRVYEWPGNIRQLINIVEQLITLVDDHTIRITHLPNIIKEQKVEFVEEENSLKSERIEKEKLLIKRILEEVDGNKTKAAKRLGIHRTTIYKKIRQYGLNH
ncbi:sigma-54 interaction domain-containing protein [Halalkalibacter kiskunsagensis]|uniref:Sigma-54 interaction domain-containing protein n=1 Tax=Halalkalibacter kiskunsagensis TaxID=1548599 RepID=A0ABV6KK18_9BACI